MQTPILALGGPTTGLSNSATRHIALIAGNSGSSWLTTAAAAQIPIPLAGTISKLRARYPVALSAGQTHTINVQVGGIDSALTCQITDAAITASDLSNTVSVSAGDLLSIENTPANTPNAQAQVQIGLAFDATASGKSVMFARHSASTSTGPFYLPIGSTASDGFTTEDNVEIQAPCAGTMDLAYFYLSAAPGTTSTRTYTIRKNGADTGLTVTYAAGESGVKSVTSSVGFNATDTLSVACTTNAVAPASATCGIGIGWTPAVDGESIQALRAGAFSRTVTSYGNAGGSVNTGLSTEADSYNVAPVAFTARKLRAVVSTAPAAGKSWTYTLRNAAASTALTCQISDAEVADGDTSNDVSIAAGDLIDLQSLPAGTPAAITSAMVAWVTYIAPAGGGASPRTGLLLTRVG